MQPTIPVPSIRLACQTCNVDIITFEWHVISSHKEIQGVSGLDKGWITVLSSYCCMVRFLVTGSLRKDGAHIVILEHFHMKE